MKKILSALLATAILFLVTACGENSEGNGSYNTAETFDAAFESSVNALFDNPNSTTEPDYFGTGTSPQTAKPVESPDNTTQSAPSSTWIESATHTDTVSIKKAGSYGFTLTITSDMIKYLSDCLASGKRFNYEIVFGDSASSKTLMYGFKVGAYKNKLYLTGDLAMYNFSNNYVTGAKSNFSYEISGNTFTGTFELDKNYGDIDRFIDALKRTDGDCFYIRCTDVDDNGRVTHKQVYYLCEKEEILSNATAQNGSELTQQDEEKPDYTGTYAFKDEDTTAVGIVFRFKQDGDNLSFELENRINKTTLSRNDFIVSFDIDEAKQFKFRFTTQDVECEGTLKFYDDGVTTQYIPMNSAM